MKLFFVPRSVFYLHVTILFLNLGSAVFAQSDEDDDSKLTAEERKARAFDDTPKRAPVPTPAPTPAYESFQNQNNNKWQMLEIVDQHLANIKETLVKMEARLIAVETTVKLLPTEIATIRDVELPELRKKVNQGGQSVVLAPGTGTGGGTAAATSEGTPAPTATTKPGGPTTLAKLFEGFAEGDLQSMKAKVDELTATTIPNVQFELSVLKDSVRNLEATFNSVELIKMKGGTTPATSIEVDKKKAP